MSTGPSLFAGHASNRRAARIQAALPTFHDNALDLAILPKVAGLLIPITAILLPIFIVGIVLYFKQRQREA